MTDAWLMKDYYSKYWCRRIKNALRSFLSIQHFWISLKVLVSRRNLLMLHVPLPGLLSIGRSFCGEIWESIVMLDVMQSEWRMLQTEWHFEIWILVELCLDGQSKIDICTRLPICGMKLYWHENDELYSRNWMFTVSADSVFYAFCLYPYTSFHSMKFSALG